MSRRLRHSHRQRPTPDETREALARVSNYLRRRAAPTPRLPTVVDGMLAALVIFAVVALAMRLGAYVDWQTLLGG